MMPHARGALALIARKRAQANTEKEEWEKLLRPIPVFPSIYHVLALFPQPTPPVGQKGKAAKKRFTLAGQQPNVLHCFAVHSIAKYRTLNQTNTSMTLSNTCISITKKEPERKYCTFFLSVQYSLQNMSFFSPV